MNGGNKTEHTYISLAEAARRCNYTQEYLSLRARQGKLKSKKVGRNWVTTIAWLEQYKVEMGLYLKEKTSGFAACNDKPYQGDADAGFSRSGPGSSPAFKGGNEYRLERAILNFSILLLIASMGAVVLLPKIDNTFDSSAVTMLREYGAWFEDKVLFVSLVVDGNSTESSASLVGVFEGLIVKVKDSFVFVWRGIDERTRFLTGGEKNNPSSGDGKFSGETAKLEENIISDIRKRFGEFRGETGVAGLNGNNDGLVVIPSSERDEVVRQTIQQSFSDDVLVEPEDENSGIVRPLFKNMSEQAYLYMMVPVKN